MAGAVRRRGKTKPSRQNSSASTGSSSHHPSGSSGGNSNHGSSAAGGSYKKSLLHKNLSMCLARGATARNLHPTLLQPLTADEMEKDLRHMQAYAAAVKAYQQQFYVQAHGSNDAGSNSTNAVATPTAPLPIRIDPEEEKRLITLRKKICRAEVIREEAEQHYVASRAHYVHTVQDLERTSALRFHAQEFLQKCVATRAAVVATQRARLQMARDMKEALTARIEALQAFEDERRRMSDGAPPAPFVPHLTGDDPLTTLWNQVEEEYKKVTAACYDKRKKPLQWPATHLPATPPGIPILVSAASQVPDKSVAFSAKHMFGANDSSLVWMPEHLGLPAVEETDEEIAAVERLEAQVERLEAELDKERRVNQQVCQQIGATRARNDEWVAMMAILRQETEAVLHRHNTILQSDQAVAAATRLADSEEAAAAAVAKNQGGATSTSNNIEKTSMILDTDQGKQHQGDNQEDSNSEDKQVGNDDSNNDDPQEQAEEGEEDVNNKRSVEEIQDGVAGARNKRRRF